MGKETAISIVHWRKSERKGTAFLKIGEREATEENLFEDFIKLRDALWESAPRNVGNPD